MSGFNLPPGVTSADIEAQIGDVLDDGGPAFPVLRVSRSDFYSTGMSLRDYFIAHAPAEPQQWFIPRMVEACPVVQSQLALTPEQRADTEREWDAGEGSQWAKDWCLANEVARQGQEVWQVEFRKQLYVQWPAAWADEMLKARAA